MTPGLKTRFSISTRINFELWGFQGKQGANFDLDIENEADSNGCVWSFFGNFGGELSRGKTPYTGQDVEVLKKIFNEMIRHMMKRLSENPEDREAEE